MCDYCGSQEALEPARHRQVGEDHIHVSLMRDLALYESQSFFPSMTPS